MRDDTEQSEGQNASGERTLLEAEFLPAAPMYYSVSATFGIGLAIFFIVVSTVWFTFGLTVLLFAIPIGVFFGARWYYGLFYKRLECVLTDRKLIVGRGVINRTEQAVPLDKITDMQMNQGPIMRWLDIESMKVETAGQTAGVGGALVGLVGIKDSREFRAAVLAQRDKVVGRADTGAPTAPAVSAGTAISNDHALLDIRDTLRRIETHLERSSDV